MSRTKRWTLWSMWDARVMGLSLFDTKEVSGMARAKINCNKTALKEFINCTLDRVMDPTVFRFDEEDFVAFRIIQKRAEDGFFPKGQRLELEALRIKFSDDARITDEKCPAHIVVCDGLAQILRATVSYSDVLVISGGYEVLYQNQASTRSLYILNRAGHEHTQIVRVCSITAESEADMICLVEKIKPKYESDDRFVFNYMAQRNVSKRSVEQHRRFVYEEFCQNVTDTLAYDKRRWDFPVPIVRKSQARATFDMLFDPKLKLVSSSPTSFTQKNSDFDNESSERVWFSTSPTSPPSDEFGQRKRLKKKVTFLIDEGNPDEDIEKQPDTIKPFPGSQHNYFDNSTETCSDDESDDSAASEVLEPPISKYVNPHRSILPSRRYSQSMANKCRRRDPPCCVRTLDDGKQPASCCMLTMLAVLFMIILAITVNCNYWVTFGNIGTAGKTYNFSETENIVNCCGRTTWFQELVLYFQENIYPLLSPYTGLKFILAKMGLEICDCT